jgi:predicted TPR repeat methyltransferase
MSVFREYAEYYDLLYSDKDYTGEANFVRERLGTLKQGATLLELGSGTGRHAQAFSELGLRVTGVDLSPEMVEQARRRNCEGAGRELSPEFHV